MNDSDAAVGVVTEDGVLRYCQCGYRLRAEPLERDWPLEPSWLFESGEPGEYKDEKERPIDYCLGCGAHLRMDSLLTEPPDPATRQRRWVATCLHDLEVSAREVQAAAARLKGALEHPDFDWVARRDFLAWLHFKQDEAGKDG